MAGHIDMRRQPIWVATAYCDEWHCPWESGPQCDDLRAHAENKAKALLALHTHNDHQPKSEDES